MYRRPAKFPFLRLADSPQGGEGGGERRRVGQTAPFSSAKPELKAREQRAARAKFIREILDIPRRARPKTSRPASWHARLQSSSPRYYRGRELRASSGRGPLSVVFRGSPSTRPRTGRVFRLPRSGAKIFIYYYWSLNPHFSTGFRFYIYYCFVYFLNM